MMLSVRNVAKKYRGERSVDAVRDLSFDLDQGLFMSLVGRSGSGKSSLLAAIGGISRPTSGTILIDGVDQWALSDDRHADFRNQEIGYVFQFASLLPSLRAIDNVALPALMGGKLSEKAAYARARMLLERVGLGERVDFFPGHLSGGEQRRVAIARALINSPRLLLADEPTADLDEKTEEEILNLLIDIHRSYGLTLLVVTHNPAIAQRADRLLELQDGLMIRESAGAGVGAGVAAGLVDSAGPAAGVFEIDQALVEKERVSLGVGIERYVGRLVLMVVPLVLVFWGLNLAVSKYEAGVLEAQQERRSAVEELAMKDLRADINDVTFAEGKGYVLSLYLQNVAGDKEIYVMSPTVRGFIQVGSSWQEVKLTALDGGQVGAKVQKIEGEKIYKYLLEPDVDDFAQLLPYYMHIRISNDMLVSPSSEPKNDLVDRSDNYYVYLKPHDASDEAILKKMKFPGKPPVWIPMPPH